MFTPLPGIRERTVDVYTRPRYSTVKQAAGMCGFPTFFMITPKIRVMIRKNTTQLVSRASI